MGEFRTVFFPAAIYSVSMWILLPYVAVVLTALVSVFHHRSLKKRYGDPKGIWIYFVVFFVLLVAIPVLVIFFWEAEPLEVLHGLGVGLGNWTAGLSLIGVFVPIALFIGHLMSKTGEMKIWYPLSKQVCARDGSFLLYELGYLVLYYTAWEFLYRGLLFFPLLSVWGFVPAFAISTALSTLHHIGHPQSEIWGALLAGVVFSVVALLTRSILYPIAIHAMIGITNDTFIYLRNYRKRR